MTYKTFTFLAWSYNLLIICSSFYKQASASSFTFSTFLALCCKIKEDASSNTKHEANIGDQCVVTCPGHHVSGYLLSIGIPAHSQSPGPLSLHCPGQINLCWVYLLWSVQLSLLLPSFLWFVREECETTQGQYRDATLEACQSTAFIVSVGLLSFSLSFILYKISTVCTYSSVSRGARHCDSWCNMTSLVSGGCLPWSCGHLSITHADTVTMMMSLKMFLQK